jgi:hypothetical protein
MKATDSFKNTIQDHLKNLAAKDLLFATTLNKPNKNIDDCINYIFDTVKKSGCNGFADEEIFGMAVHYYDEDDIKPVVASKCRVVVNHTTGNSKQGVSSHKEDKSIKKAIKKQPIINQPSLF